MIVSATMEGEINLSNFIHMGTGPDLFHDINFPESAVVVADLFNVLEAWEAAASNNGGGTVSTAKEEFTFPESEHICKKQKVNIGEDAVLEVSGQHRISHITVERNRRKQMNEHLAVLRSLMPCFYVKRGDQASIIGGVVDYIRELQQVLQSLESRRQRKAYSEEVLSPRIMMPLSPKTPQPSTSYKPSWIGYQLNSPSPVDRLPPSPGCSSSVNDAINELVANSKSATAEVEVKFSGPNLVLKTVSHPIPGQAMRIVSTLEDLALEILHLKINTIDQTRLNVFTVKIGIECQVSAEELAQQIQWTFC